MTCLGVRDDFLLLLVCCATTILGDFRLKFWFERLMISSVILTANIGWWKNNNGGIEFWNCLIYFVKDLFLPGYVVPHFVQMYYYPWKWETGGTSMGKFEFNWKWNRWPQQPQRAGEESTEGSSDQFAVCFFGGWWVMDSDCETKQIFSFLLFETLDNFFYSIPSSIDIPYLLS